MAQIRSIQRGTATVLTGNTTVDVAITAVDTDATSLFFLGISGVVAGGELDTAVRINLESSTVVRGTRSASPASSSGVASFEVIEEYP